MEVTHSGVECLKCHAALENYRLPDGKVVLVHPEFGSERMMRSACEYSGKLFERPAIQVREVELTVTRK